ncbi:MAG: hypothetical protein QM668_21510 [Agriterribacter sp.]
MSKKDNGKKFKIADPVLQLAEILKQQSKYKLGEKGYSFYDIKNLKPVFAFDYLSLNNSDLCFNSTKLDVKDYIGLLEGLKIISAISYNDLNTNRNYRFHKIDFDNHNVSISRKDFKKMLTFKDDLLKDEELPTLYQLDLHYVQEARACGFLYKGIFYLVWFDRHHIIYPGDK